MGRAATALVVVAVAAVAVAAVVDALRREGTPADDLHGLGVAGRLVYADGDCRIRALALPDLVAAGAPEGPASACRLALSADGRRVAAGDAAWNRLGSVYARCRAGRVGVVVPPNGRPQYAFDGCAPAWRPTPQPPWADLVTVARGTRIVEVDPACASAPPCVRELLSRDDTLAAAVRHPEVDADLGNLTGFEIADAAWLSPERLVLLLRLRIYLGTTRGVIALFESGSLVWAHALPHGRAARIVVAPDGRRIAAPGVLLTPDGEAVPLPRALERAHALAFSPDGRALAAATPEAIVVVRLDDPARIVRLPIAARDVAWR